MKNRELIHQMVDRVRDIQEQTEPYVSLELNNHNRMSIWVQLGGWDRDKEFNLSESFSVKDDESSRFMAVMKYLKGLLDAGGR